MSEYNSYATAESNDVGWTKPTSALGEPNGDCATLDGGNMPSLDLGFEISIPANEEITGIKVIVTGLRSSTGGGGE